MNSGHSLPIIAAQAASASCLKSCRYFNSYVERERGGPTLVSRALKSVGMAVLLLSFGQPIHAQLSSSQFANVHNGLSLNDPASQYVFKTDFGTASIPYISATTGGGPESYLHASIAAPSLINGYVASAHEFYQFKVVGAPHTSVPVLMHGNISYSTDLHTGADLSVSVSAAYKGTLYYLRRVSADAPSLELTFDQLLQLETDDIVSVTLEVGLAASRFIRLGPDSVGAQRIPWPGPGAAEGTIDPIFYIDPAFAAANPSVSLEFSAGYTAAEAPSTATPVPEPGSMGLIAGACMLAAVSFRKRRNLGKFQPVRRH